MKKILILANFVLFWLILVFIFFRLKQINKEITNIHSDNKIPKQCRNLFFIIVLITIIFMTILDIFIAYTI